MKKCFFVCFAISFFSISGALLLKSVQEKKMSDPLVLANVAALAGWGDYCTCYDYDQPWLCDECGLCSYCCECDDGGGCPDYNYVPDRFIEVTVESFQVTSDANGNIQIGDFIKGGYAKNTTYWILLAIYNCSGEQEGACCDQREVRVEFL